MLLDTTYRIDTPEGVELKLPIAGLGARSLAWLIDAFLKAIVIMISSLLLRILGGLGIGLWTISVFVCLWFYNVLFEVLSDGATPGKKTVGLRVMNDNGTPVGWTGSLLRNLIRAVDALPGCYLFGCIAVLVSGNFQRLGDLAAGTIVVHVDKTVSGSSLANAEPLPVKVPLTLEEQQAIVSFGERAERLNRARAEELAALLKPVLGDIDAGKLRGHAAWLAGSEGGR